MADLTLWINDNRPLLVRILLGLWFLNLLLGVFAQVTYPGYLVVQFLLLILAGHFWSKERAHQRAAG